MSFNKLSLAKEFQRSEFKKKKKERIWAFETSNLNEQFLIIWDEESDRHLKGHIRFNWEEFLRWI